MVDQLRSVRIHVDDVRTIFCEWIWMQVQLYVRTNGRQDGTVYVHQAVAGDDGGVAE